jgi:hypothetical protein
LLEPQDIIPITKDTLKFFLSTKPILNSRLLSIPLRFLLKQIRRSFNPIRLEFLQMVVVTILIMLLSLLDTPPIMLLFKIHGAPHGDKKATSISHGLLMLVASWPDHIIQFIDPDY